MTMLAAWLLACCLQAPAEVSIDSDRVTLGAVFPLDSGDPRAGVVLGYSPQPGLARRFTKPELLSKITASGLSTAGLDLPDFVLVRRKAELLETERVRIAIQQAFARQYPRADVTILSIEIPQTQLGAGPLDLTATLPQRADLTAPMSVRVDIRGNGFSKSIFVRTLAEVLTPQLVLRNSVTAGSSIRPEDVELRAVPMRGVTQPISTLESLQGLVASRNLQPDQILAPDLLFAPLLVRRGESVTVKASAGGVTIAATMRAKSDARFGDTILVEHLSGNGATSARVIGSRALEALQGVR